MNTLNTNQLKKDDILVIFGEVFERGYVNGVIDEAKKMGMRIVYSTVGRRDAEQKLRPLTEIEIADKKQVPLINIPLEAGFDLEADSRGVRPVDQLKDYGLTGWENAKLDWPSIEECRKKGEHRFRNYTELFLAEVDKLLKPGQNVVFVHTMAGGFPRAKVVMPIANRVFKGQGARYQSSEIFWNSEIGQLCDLSFKEVTANTLKHLIELSTPLRNKIASLGGQTHYLAFGYHGNAILIGDEYKWYSYSPYLQGFAKLELEDICKKARLNGIKATTFNVPEILTNSSSIFLGIEVVLYPLLRALKKEGPNHPKTKQTLEKCEALLHPQFTFEDIDNKTQNYLSHPVVQAWPNLETWPQHNHPEQMEMMLNASSEIIEMHKNPKVLLTAELSELVFVACGKIMLHQGLVTDSPVYWIGHEQVAKTVCD